MKSIKILLLLLLFSLAAIISSLLFSFGNLKRFSGGPSISQFLNFIISPQFPSSNLHPQLSTFYLLPSNFPTPPYTLDSIFNPDHSWVDQLSKDQTFTLITTGDIIPARSVNYKMTQYNDFTHPFLKTADFLLSADLTLINLEAPLIPNCPITNEGMVFCGNQKFIEGLKFSGIDVVNLANNHILNWGVDGLEQTIILLNNNGILTTGYPPNKLTTQQFGNLKLGFLGWNLLDAFNEQEILETIRLTKKQVDLLIISPHWGAEYQSYPAPQTVNLAHQMIDAGADIISGNHPHWIEPLEIYQGKLIIYSHSNFIFDQEWSNETKTGFVAKHTFYNNKLVDTEIFPVLISDFNQPEFLTGEQKQTILNHLQTISLTK